MAALKWGTHGGWHGHFDRISLLALQRYGKDFYGPRTDHFWFGYGSDHYKMWGQASASHNMVIVDQLQQLAQLAGVEIDVEEPEGDEMEMEMDLAEDTLEEILDGILSEEAEEETLEEAVEEEALEEGEHEDEEEAPAKRDYMQEELVQEVLKRVKERLAQLSQEQ